MQTSASQQSTILSGKLSAFANECCISDTDYFFKTLTKIQEKGVKPDLIASIITHYVSKCLPDSAGDAGESATASWRKKKLFIETLVGILPKDNEAVPCSLLLRILRAAIMVGVEAGCRDELEERVSRQLDQASLRDLMIPCCGHECATLLDFELVLRLVRKFLSSEEVARSGGALMRVAKLVDCYIAEAAVDCNLKLGQFFALATVLPSHARSTDDRLYRAIDIYLKAHPDLSKQDRKRLCTLIESRKLSAEASIHAAQNERLPVRAVIQVLLSEQDKLSRHIDWSGSLSGTRSPGMGMGMGLDARCHSKREVASTQQLEIRRLKEDVLMLQSQCMSMERQIEKLLEKKKGYNFSWKKLGMDAFRRSKMGPLEGGDAAAEAAALRMNTPMQMKARLVGGRSSSKKWRKSRQGN